MRRAWIAEDQRTAVSLSDCGHQIPGPRILSEAGNGARFVSLDDCLARINRAEQHLGGLADLLDRYINGDTHVVEVKVDPDTIGPVPMDGRPSGTQIVVVGRARGEPPTLAASLIVADVLNSLRAALDNMTWSLSVMHSGPAPLDPIPSRDPWRRVRFPITAEASKWVGISDSALKFVDPGLVSLFRSTQPFERRGDHPERDDLAVLEELWNIDKHRHLVLAEYWVSLHGVESTMQDFYGKLPVTGPGGEQEPFPPGHFRGHTFEIVSRRNPGPFVGGAELGRVVENGSIRTLGPHLHINPILVRDVIFDRGAPAYGGRVIETLTRISGTVRAVLESFRSYTI
jgi:hypothetical protein